MTTVTKKDLIDRIALRTKRKRSVVKQVLQQFLDEIVEELAEGNRLEFRDFGVFQTRIRASRMAQNPKTGEQVYVPARRSVKFKVGRMMRRRVIETAVAEDEHPSPKEATPKRGSSMASGEAAASSMAPPAM